MTRRILDVVSEELELVRTAQSAAWQRQLSEVELERVRALRGDTGGEAAGDAGAAGGSAGDSIVAPCDLSRDFGAFAASFAERGGVASGAGVPVHGLAFA